MNNNLPVRIILVGTCFFGTVATGFAQESKSPISGQIMAGYEYDSNLTVDTIDSTSNVGDGSIVFDGSVDFDVIDKGNTNLSVGYNFYQTLHNDLDQFDLQIHGFNGGVSHNIDRIDVGASYLFNAIKLGDESFLNMNTFTPSVGYLMPNNKVYLTVLYELQKQNFKRMNLEERDATRNSASVKALFILGNGRVINTGYKFSKHGAENEGYSYNGHRFDVSLKLPIDFYDKEIIFQTAYSYTIRNYSEESEVIYGEMREDRRHNISASLEVPVYETVFVKLEFEHIASNSTFLTVDYDEDITTASLGWKF